MANTKNFKVNSGIQPTAYHEAVGTASTGSTTVGYDISVASYDSKLKSLTGQTTAPHNAQFKTDGTKMYVNDLDNDAIDQYTLSTAWDVSTASYDSKTFSVASQATSPQDTSFKPDGTKMYVICANTDAVYQYSLSTAWDVSTASYDNVSASTAFAVSHAGLEFKTDGTKMYLASYATDLIYQYSLSTAWDMSTASYDSVSFSVVSEAANVRKVRFNGDGTKFIINDNASPYGIYSYNLTTAWDISTASYSGTSYSVSSFTSDPEGITFGSDGTKMYLADVTNNAIRQFSTGSTIATKTLDMSTGTVFEITPTADTQIGLSNPAASGTVSQATLILNGGTTTTYDLANASDSGDSFTFTGFPLALTGAFIKPDATKFYLSSSRDIVIQYDVPGNRLNGITLETRFDAASQVVVLEGLFIDSGGTRMYLVCSNTDTIYQYTLSTAWDVSTASYDSKSFSVASQETVPQSVSFKPDGTKMYVCGNTADAVFQYSLSTAWDISTASYDSVSFSVATNPTTITFKPDGTQFFITRGATVNRYDLSTAWDMSTASDPSVSLSISNGVAAFFNSDGNALYLFRDPTAGDLVAQYNAGTMAAITYDSSIQFAAGTAPDAPTTAASESDIITFTTRDGGTTYQGILAIDGAK